MNWLVGAALVATTAAPDGLDSVREAVLRGIAAHDKEAYFVAYCVAVVPESAPHPLPRDERIKRVWSIEAPDAAPALLLRLADLKRFLPASGCMKTAGDYDVLIRSDLRKPALLIAVGPVEVITESQAAVTIFTTSGGLTETVALYSLVRDALGKWQVVLEQIVLQV